jgi:hypothetical protein
MTKPNNEQEAILGHLLNEQVKELKSQIQLLFPDKKYHIGELTKAKEEQGKDVNTDCLAVSMPEITECIAIWLNSKLPSVEFNSVLAEELFHHKQAFEKYSTIIGLNPTKQGVNFSRVATYLEALCKELVSIVLDLDAHSRMRDSNIDLEPILSTDLRFVSEAIAESASSFSKLAELKDGKATISAFPNYLLWWFDLNELGVPSYVKTWNEKIRPWFVQNLSKDNMECWDELTEFIHNHPVTDSRSAEIALTIICQRLFFGTPVFSQIRTSGRSVSNLC